MSNSAEMDSSLVTADLSKISTPTDLPSDVYKLMIKNATSHQRSRLMEVGKYFYPQKFIAVWQTEIRDDEIKCYKDDTQSRNVSVDQSLWITLKLPVEKSTDVIFSLLPKTAFWNLQWLSICCQIIHYEDLKYFNAYGRIHVLQLDEAPVRYRDTDKEVPLEKIFELFPKLEYIRSYSTTSSIASLEAANTHCPSRLRYIFLRCIYERFDFKAFSSFMLSHQHIHYDIEFFWRNTEIYIKQLKLMIDEVHRAWDDKDALPRLQI